MPPSPSKPGTSSEIPVCLPRREGDRSSAPERGHFGVDGMSHASSSLGDEPQVEQLDGAPSAPRSKTPRKRGVLYDEEWLLERAIQKNSEVAHLLSVHEVARASSYAMSEREWQEQLTNARSQADALKLMIESMRREHESELSQLQAVHDDAAARYESAHTQLLARLERLRSAVARTNKRKREKSGVIAKLTECLRKLRNEKRVLVTIVRNQRNQQRVADTTLSPSTPCAVTPASGSGRKRRSLSRLKTSQWYARVDGVITHIDAEAGDGDDEQRVRFVKALLAKLTEKWSISLPATVRKMSVDDATRLLLRFFTNRSFERFKSELIKLDLNIFPGTGKCKANIRNATARCPFEAKSYIYRRKVAKRGRPSVEVEILKALQPKKKKVKSLRMQATEELALPDEEVEEDRFVEMEGVAVTMKNAGDEIRRRIFAKSMSGTLKLTAEFIDAETGKPEIWLRVSADAADGKTKIALSIVNCEASLSSFNATVVSLWDGADKRAYFEEHAREIIDMLNSFTSVKVMTPRGEEEVVVRQFLVGDAACRCAILGLDGGNASFNCEICLRRNGSTHADQVYRHPVTGRWTFRVDVGPKRNLQLADMHSQLPKGSNFNQTNAPLLDRVTFDQVALDPLHILLGMSDTIDGGLRSAVIARDYSDAGIPWAGDEKAAEKALVARRKELSAASQRRNTLVNSALTCAHPEQAARLQRLADEQAEYCTMMAQECKQRKKFLRLDGPWGVILHKRLAKHRLIGTFYHAKTGVQMQRMLKPEVIEELFDQFPNAAFYKNLALVFAEVLTYAEARVYRDEEIESFGKLVLKIAHAMATGPAKDRKITMKWHEFYQHVLPFFRRWKSWGLFSSEQIEALHPRTSNLFLLYASVRPKKQMYLSVCSRLHAQSLFFDTQTRESRAAKEEKKAAKSAKMATPRKKAAAHVADPSTPTTSRI